MKKYKYLKNILPFLVVRDIKINHSNLSIPLSRCLYFFDTSAPPPQAASTCSHRLLVSQMSAICGIGSNAPRTVVPSNNKVD